MSNRRRHMTFMATSPALVALVPSGRGETIGFSGPAPDHGWLGAVTKAAKAEAAE